MATRTLAARLPRLPRGVLHRLVSLMGLRASRRRLGELDARMLRDIGLTPEEAAAESERPFWDAPPGWRR